MSQPHLRMPFSGKISPILSPNLSNSSSRSSFGRGDGLGSGSSSSRNSFGLRPSLQGGLGSASVLADAQEQDIQPYLSTSREVTITKNKSAKFGADLLRIDKEYYVIRVYEVDISRGVTSEKTGAYRMGLSFGDRIVSINRHAASQIDDVRHVLDDATTVTVEFVGQPLFMKVMLHVSDGQLEGLKLKGRKVEEIMSTSAAYHRGVRTGHVVFAVEEVSCLGDSDDVVEQLVNSYLPKHRYLNFMFVGETVWYLFLEGVEAMIARSGKSVSVRQYVGHSLMLDKERMEGYKVETVYLNTPNSPRIRPRVRRFFR